MPHLVAAVSAHGYGHFAQTAPVLNALWRRLPGLRVTLRTALPHAFLASRLERPFEHVCHASDFGMLMHSALDVQREESARAYQAFHQDWDAKVAAEGEALQALAPDLVLANVPYLTLAGAAHAGIPTVALCSLNWADIYQHYCGGRPEAPDIHAQMLAAYNAAAYFLQPRPSMPMDGIHCRRAIGPIARLGVNRRQTIDEQMGLKGDQRLVLVATGGIDTQIPAAQWPRRDHLRWVVPAAWGVERDDMFTHELCGLSFTDLMCSCDVLVTKPGYGTFAEAACNGVPVLYVPRGDWPEEPYVTAWLAANAVAAQITREQLFNGDLEGPIEALLGHTPQPGRQPSGAEEAAEIIASLLDPLHGDASKTP